MNHNHIFVDTNVLIGAYSNRQNDKLCLQYIYSLKGKKLYTSTLSIAQLVSVFQKTKANEEIKTIVRSIIQKFTVIGFVQNDIEQSMMFIQSDMEDNIQYVISGKMKCFHFVTNNIKDYNNFYNINVLKPQNIRKINQ
ncbi:MAG: type II toxin-antitoxin system VapC family toxin [Paludibacteraceae bacterium]|nr:type II toxin-antitoxin system VapC family toxin [Paludibacteraceae bacterium]